jgi:tRNA threonylcarbamoyl adenosine modification protein (Sua5/YciO/YrdC/YwlC family)
MAAIEYFLHYDNPELRKVAKIIDSLKNGAVILYPTDTGFALGCELSNREAISKIRFIRHLPENKQMTFLCHSISNISEFAKVSNLAYRAIKRLIPGPYTFVLPASKLVPKYAQDSKRKTTGIRVPEHNIATCLLSSLGRPVISISAKPEDDEPFSFTPDEIIEKFSPVVDITISSDNYHFCGESTVIDMMNDEFSIIREGAGMLDLREKLGIESILI